jgi:hypothetical protein
MKFTRTIFSGPVVAGGEAVSLDKATGCTVGESNPDKYQRFFSSKRLIRLWGLFSLLFI